VPDRNLKTTPHNVNKELTHTHQRFHHATREEERREGREEADHDINRCEMVVALATFSKAVLAFIMLRVRARQREKL
jgi:hypothetical protein